MVLRVVAQEHTPLTIVSSLFRELKTESFAIELLGTRHIRHEHAHWTQPHHAKRSWQHDAFYFVRAGALHLVHASLERHALVARFQDLLSVRNLRQVRRVPKVAVLRYRVVGRLSPFQPICSMP